MTPQEQLDNLLVYVVVDGNEAVGSVCAGVFTTRERAERAIEDYERLFKSCPDMDKSAWHRPIVVTTQVNSIANIEAMVADETSEQVEELNTNIILGTR